MRATKIVVAFAALFLSSALCGRAALGAERARIVFGYSTIGAMAAGAWMAKEIGAFDKYGIDAELIYISSGPVVVQALLGGDLQAGLAATNATIAAVLRGAPLVSVMSTANRPYHRLWVQPEINKLEDLRGKVLGVTRFGAVTDNLTRILLKRNGLENAVSIRQLGGTMEVGAAFSHRQIDGAVTSTLRVDPQARPKLLLKLEDMGIQYSMDVIVVSRDYLRRNAPVLEAMTRAYVEGVAAIHRDKATAVRAIARFARLTDPRLIEEIYQDSIVYLEKTPRLEPEATTPILESIGKKDVAMDTFADNSIVDRLTREKFIEKLYKK